MSAVYEQLVFDCPVHGLETVLGCSRALLEEYADRWIKQRVTVESLGYPTKEEVLEHLEKEWVISASADWGKMR